MPRPPHNCPSTAAIRWALVLTARSSRSASCCSTSRSNVAHGICFRSSLKTIFCCRTALILFVCPDDSQPTEPKQNQCRALTQAENVPDACGTRPGMTPEVFSLSGNDAGAVSVLSPYNGDNDDKIPDQNEQSRSRGKPEPQGPRQRAQRSPRHHQGPSRRRETEHPRAGRAREYGAEHDEQKVGVMLAVIPGRAQPEISRFPDVQ